MMERWIEIDLSSEVVAENRWNLVVKEFSIEKKQQLGLHIRSFLSSSFRLPLACQTLLSYYPFQWFGHDLSTEITSLSQELGLYVWELWLWQWCIEHFLYGMSTLLEEERSQNLGLYSYFSTPFMPWLLHYICRLRICWRGKPIGWGISFLGYIGFLSLRTDNGLSLSVHPHTLSLHNLLTTKEISSTTWQNMPPLTLFKSWLDIWGWFRSYGSVGLEIRVLLSRLCHNFPNPDNNISLWLQHLRELQLVQSCTFVLKNYQRRGYILYHPGQQHEQRVRIYRFQHRMMFLCYYSLFSHHHHFLLPFHHASSPLIDKFSPFSPFITFCCLFYQQTSWRKKRKNVISTFWEQLKIHLTCPTSHTNDISSCPQFLTFASPFDNSPPELFLP